MKNKKFDTMQEMVEWLDGQSDTAEFRTKGYKLDERYHPGLSETYHVLVTTYGSGLSTRYFEIELPTDVAEVLKASWPKVDESRYADYKGRRPLSTVLNILKKASPDVAQFIENLHTRQQMENRRRILRARLGELTGFRSSAMNNITNGDLFIRADQLMAFDQMMASIENQIHAIDEVIGE